MKEPTAECIAVRAFFGVEFEDEVVVEDLIFKANNEWSDIASNVVEMPYFSLLNIFDSCKTFFNASIESSFVEMKTSILQGIFLR